MLVSSFDELTQIGKEISHSGKRSRTVAKQLSIYMLFIAVGSGGTKHNDVDILPVTKSMFILMLLRELLLNHLQCPVDLCAYNVLQIAYNVRVYLV